MCPSGGRSREERPGGLVGPGKRHTATTGDHRKSPEAVEAVEVERRSGRRAARGLSHRERGGSSTACRDGGSGVWSSPSRVRSRALHRPEPMLGHAQGGTAQVLTPGGPGAGEGGTRVASRWRRPSIRGHADGARPHAGCADEFGATVPAASSPPPTRSVNTSPGLPLRRTVRSGGNHDGGSPVPLPKAGACDRGRPSRRLP